ncbi:MAG: hypothetical protein DIZ77_18695 [endosymbiont of Seepiophila jonesi]|uniref:Uncharacterized protein n=1 Tax=endosymbiont of Lamellibrachia luymesi TaxID=2200907 RepID=A0A370DZJ6_9GAMM|nr:MAG: hypothetical protein DIZ77_18695 [endosymbiont of Seepiophila jonesi]RDH92149.1 MAG: hypothetical protein DIZ79_04335 [endosymbiont of Lamellibrachia luymesi]
MLKLYEAADRIEAQMLKDFLLEQGVETVLLGDYLSGAAGELAANIFPALWVVNEEDLPRAKILLQFFTNNRIPVAGEVDWVCPECGEKVDADFDLCWNCATPRRR